MTAVGSLIDTTWGTERSDHASAIGVGELLAVGEVRRRTGVTRKALRVYEDHGLVRPAARTTAGYRLYDHDALRRIQLVAQAKLLGLSLAEAAELLDINGGGCGDKKNSLVTMIAAKLDQTVERLEQLNQLRLTQQLALHALSDQGDECKSDLCFCLPLEPVEEAAS